jgi:integrase/recombinase XerD
MCIGQFSCGENVFVIAQTTFPFPKGRRQSIRKVDAVWVSEVGTQIEQAALAHRIVKHTKVAFGRSVSPHLFRDCVATSIALDNPKHVGDASLVLGHAGHRVTEKHYNHAWSLEASRRHATTIARLRETLNAGRKG